MIQLRWQLDYLLDLNHFPGEEPQYFIIVENEILCICRSFSYAIMVWFISHYVFNLEYSIKVREVALFVQELQNCNLSDCFYRHTSISCCLGPSATLELLAQL